MPQLRRDPVTREWVIIASDREQRPSDYRQPDGRDELPEIKEDCPFCPGSEHMTPPEVLAYRSPDTEPNSKGWWIRVVPNKFPVLSREGVLERQGFGMYDTLNAVGAHEVIIESPRHNDYLATMSIDQLCEVLWAYRDRCLDLSQDPLVKYTMLFRNRGPVAGASLEHPHSQLVALPMIPQWVQLELAGTKAFYEYHERCVYCDMIRQEKQFGERMIAENSEFIAFCPFAPKYPFEMLIVPKGHRTAYVEETRHTLEPLAEMLRDVMRRLDICLNHPPYNFTLHTIPVNVDPEPLYHWHLRILPRLTIAAGFEMGTGIYINHVAPESAAQFLRDVPKEELGAGPKQAKPEASKPVES
jgi:UDPglucose--hexose-1-phosphate uridylyltransferase